MGGNSISDIKPCQKSLAGKVIGSGVDTAAVILLHEFFVKLLSKYLREHH